MTRKQKKQGKAIARILDAETRIVVGYLYQWDTGDIQAMWNDDIKRENVIYD